MRMQHYFPLPLAATEIPGVAMIPFNSYLNPKPVEKINFIPFSFPIIEMQNWKYERCNDIPGKIFDYLTGMTLDEAGNRNPSIFGKIKNLFKSKVENNQHFIKNVSTQESSSTSANESDNENTNIVATIFVAGIGVGMIALSTFFGIFYVCHLINKKSQPNEPNPFLDQFTNTENNIEYSPIN